MKIRNRLLAYSLVGLIVFNWTNGVLAQPTINMLRVPPSGFLPSSNTETYSKGSNYLSTSGTGTFYFPVTLPNGSIIRQIELNCYENDASGYLRLSLVSSRNSFPVVLGSVSSLNDTVVQNIKSSEINHQIDYSNNSYTLALYFAAHSSPLNFYSAVIYYLPPSSSIYLPQIKKE